MWNNDIMLFVVMFVLSIVLIDETVKAFFSEFIIFVFAMIQLSEKMSHGSTILTEYDYLLGGFLFFLNALVAFTLMFLWLLERRKGESI